MSHILSEVIEVVVRTSIIYIFVVSAILAFGRSELSQLSIFDLVFVLLISNSVQNAMVGESNSIIGGISSALTLFLLKYTFKALRLKYEFLNKITEGEAIPLIVNGKKMQKNLKRNRISDDELMSVIREHGIEHIHDVKAAFLEVDGDISIIQMNEEYIKKSKRLLPKELDITKTDKP